MEAWQLTSTCPVASLVYECGLGRKAQEPEILRALPRGRKVPACLEEPADGRVVPNVSFHLSPQLQFLRRENHVHA